MRVWPGSPVPLGATFDGSGVNFALFSEHATNVELCLFDSEAARAERDRVRLVERTGPVWHAYLPDVGPGQLYGYRVSGPWDPAAGHRFNPAKVVLDPYARTLGRSLAWDNSLFAFDRTKPGARDLDRSDSAPFAPLARVEAAEPFDWGADRRPRVDWPDTILDELHVKGFTALNPVIPSALRGSYLGVASPSAIAHLKDLGVTSVELMPVHLSAPEWQLAEAGRTNYWGYNTLSYFIPDVRYVSTRSPLDAGREFKTMVRALHAAGLEVILDVVYNHSAEGDHLGPTLSFRGIDNRSYYRLDNADRALYENFSGCGNTLDLRSPAVVQLVADSLRFWVEHMHVDGFRFDLTPALAREPAAFNSAAAFLDVVRQDPVLSHVKLVAEPWDVGEDGYQLGRFPSDWREWNDRYRDDVRRFWRGDPGMVPVLATKLAGSSDVFGASWRGPSAGVNFVTAHDGFTLADLVAYTSKNNEANGEENRDGHGENLSTNSGVEGPTNDATILELRRRQRQNFLVTLLVSLGVPMISGGDELGRTQSGNNNAYMTDSAVSWTPWNDDRQTSEFLEFVRRLIAFRRAQPVLRRRAFLNGEAAGDVRWLRPDGTEMTMDDWHDRERRAFAMVLNGHAIAEPGPHGERIVGPSVAALFNASGSPVAFSLPGSEESGWTLVIDTASPMAPSGERRTVTSVTVDAHAAAVLETPA